MIFPCPYCKRKLNLLEMQLESDLMAIIKLMAFFGRNAGTVWAYIELFGITPRLAKAKKIRLLLTEIKTILDAGEFTFEKKRHRISQAGLYEGLNTCAKKNFETALKNHNYLKTVLISISEREAKAVSIEDEKKLKAKEKQLMSAAREEENVSRNPSGPSPFKDIYARIR